MLFPKIHHLSNILSTDLSITSIAIPNWTYSDIQHSILDFSEFSLVESIVIGNKCFGSVKTFRIDGLNHKCFGSVKTFRIDGLNRLKTIKIGSNSFTQKMDREGNDKS